MERALIGPIEFLIICPVCRLAVENPDTGSKANTIETLEQVEGRQDTATCPMCHQCGTFLFVEVPEILREVAVRYDHLVEEG